MAPYLELLATDLEHGAIPRDRFHEREALAPLPRAYQWADGSAYVNHVQLVRKARGAEMPGELLDRPAHVPGRVRRDAAAASAIPLADESWGCDLEAEVVVVTGDVPRGVTREEALGHIRSSACQRRIACATSSRPSSPRASASSSPSRPRRCRRCW
jgi:fumarylacetoacetate (FAA) hydrolase